MPDVYKEAFQRYVNGLSGSILTVLRGFDWQFFLETSPSFPDYRSGRVRGIGLQESRTAERVDLAL